MQTHICSDRSVVAWRWVLGVGQEGLGTEYKIEQKLLGVLDEFTFLKKHKQNTECVFCSVLCQALFKHGLIQYLEQSYQDVTVIAQSTREEIKELRNLPRVTQPVKAELRFKPKFVWSQSPKPA